MSAPHDHHDNEQPEEHFIDPNESADIIEDDGDEPMDEDDEDDIEYRDYVEGEEGEEGMQIVLEEADGPEPEDGEEEDEKPEDNSLAHSSHHDPSSSVFSISLHPLFPHPPLGISGGEDDLAFIFSPLYPSTASSSSSSTSPSNPQFKPIKLTGHTDSVIAAAFSSDGELVASGGMDGKVRVWRRVKGKAQVTEDGVKAELDSWQNWEFLTSLDTGDEVTWLSWHPKGAVLAAGCNDSTVWMWQLPSGNTMQVFSSHTSTSTQGVFSPSGKLLITASSDSSLCIWDPRSPVPLLKLHPTSTAGYGSFGEGGITALAISPASNLVAIGGENGAIRIINLPDGRVVSALSGHGGQKKGPANASSEEGEEDQNSVEGLQFMDLLGLAGPGGEAGGTRGLVLVSCGGDGRAVVWDVTTGNPRAEIGHEDVVTGIFPHPAPNRHLFTSASADRTLKTWDARQGKLIAEHKGHAGVVNALAVGVAPAGWGLPEDDADQQNAPEGGAAGLGKRKGAEVIVSAGDDGAVLAWRV